MTASPAIVLIGFMGAGKSWSLESIEDAVKATVDIDDLIEQQVGKSVRQFFDERGETEFRKIEEEVALSLLEQADGGAIALGGGTVLSERVRSALSRHIVVWLDVSLETSWARVSETERPLARDRQRFEDLFHARRPIYEALADVVLPEGDPGMGLRALPAIHALKELPSTTKLLWAASASGEYPVLVGPGLLGTGPWPLHGRRFCITDATVGPLYAARLTPLEAQIEIEPGERAKRLDVVEEVLIDLARAKMTREDHVVALGGGVVGDLAGFCAHVYQRGVPVIQVPTSLVAQVDSAYGGKTGVDMPHGKNYVGAYHLPAAVIADTGTLASLSPEELRAGFVEVLKTALLVGGDLWERVRAIETLDPGGLDEIVFACARYKCSIVAADERDSGLREVLNLGHTIGHAIEWERGTYRHGEAIGLGLLAALRLSDAADLRDEVEAILDRHGLPTVLVGDTEVILELVQGDKKRTSDGVGFVLLAEPGKPLTGQILDPEAIRAAVMELYS